MNQLLQATNLVKHFRTRGGVVRAVDGVNLSLARGQTLGLVGESGCGKSTLGRLLIQLIAADSGQIIFDGQDVASSDIKTFRKRVQIVFQDPYRSLNPRRTVGQAIAEPLLIHRLATSSTQRAQVAQLLGEVGLDASVMDRYPHEFSGGQRQRIGIARALAVQPDLIVLDEPVAALDVSVQAQIVRLLTDLQQQRGLSYVFISHNLAVVRHIAQRVAVMYLGKIVEEAGAHDLYNAPRHPYTRALLEAVPEPDVDARLQVELGGDAPDPIDVPPGCRFHTRCRLAREIASAADAPTVKARNGFVVPQVCRDDAPPQRVLDGAQSSLHRAACHFAEQVAQVES